MAYGREAEDVARKEFEKYLSKTIKINGLFIDPIDPRLGASPDELIDEDGIVEIKNPFTEKDLLPKEAMNTIPHLNFIDKRTNVVQLTHVTQREYCIFALRTTKEILDSRFLRNMHIREPNYIVEAKRQYEAIGNKKKMSQK
ncbi:hypothetical protein TSAR_013473 [Trichomalopsis sarcophagae]|uniref:YqaJ viral recombinase domain-containing protein n=1 Tax=Trichomalopsis sarcophagae TaxID=543379 RepID=A0A232EES2_9HYME|nr:hypothetical protein TSAR_013473 [Trichomalopsis sarcophagae]